MVMDAVCICLFTVIILFRGGHIEPLALKSPQKIGVNSSEERLKALAPSIDEMKIVPREWTILYAKIKRIKSKYLTTKGESLPNTHD